MVKYFGSAYIDGNYKHNTPFFHRDLQQQQKKPESHLEVVE